MLTPDALVVVYDEPVAFVVVESDGFEFEAPFEWVDVPEVSLPASEACVDGLASWPHADVAHAAHISHVGRRDRKGASWTGVKRSGRIGGWRVGSSGAARATSGPHGIEPRGYMQARTVWITAIDRRAVPPALGSGGVSAAK